jgi:hypothetical protein
MPDSFSDRLGEESSAEKELILSRIIAKYKKLPLARLQRIERTQDEWVESKPKELATFIKARKPELSDAEVAYKVVVDRSTPSRWDEYRRLKALLAAKSSMPRGIKDRNGNLEVFDDFDNEA